MRRLIAILFVILLSAGPALADLKSAVAALGTAKLDGMEAAIKALAAEQGPVPGQVLGALGEGNLYVRKSDGLVVIASPEGDGFALTDPVTGEAAGSATKSEISKIKINNALRRAIKAAAGGSALQSPDAAKRLEAAQAVFKSRDASALPALEAAFAAETEPKVKTALELARAAALLSSDRPEAEQRAAVATLAATGSRDVLPVLAAVASGTGPIALAAQEAVSVIEARLAYWGLPRISGTAYRSAPCCCWPPSAWPSPSA